MLDSLKGSPLTAFVTACVIALCLTPLVQKLAWRFDSVARPDARRTHAEPTALWGGLAIFMGVAIAALLWRQPNSQDFRFLAASGAPQDVQATAQTLHLTSVFLGCGLLMLILGMTDDRFELPPVLKFAGQAFITFLLWYGNVRIRTLPFTSGTQPLSDGASLALTMFWVMGLTNGVNFIDGVDGLAAGVCAIAAGSLCMVEMTKHANWAAAAAAAVCGASLGFLRYNFPPAKIFLGDAGALLLGFWLAAIGVAAAAKTAAATTLALPLLILGVPVFDTLWAIARRTIARQPMWRADRGHLHHRLLARGLSPRTTVFVIYAVSAFLGVVAMLWVQMRG